MEKMNLNIQLFSVNENEVVEETDELYFEFEDLPSEDTALDSENVNEMQKRIKSAIDIIKSDIATLTPKTSKTNSDDAPYSCNYIDSNFQTKGKILWTNPNPTDEMEDQTLITFSSDDYDVVTWVYDLNVGAGTRFYSSQTCLKGQNTRLFAVILNATNDTATRDLYYVSDTQYSAAPGYLQDTLQNRRCVPICAIGYNTGLFS